MFFWLIFGISAALSAVLFFLAWGPVWPYGRDAASGFGILLACGGVACGLVAIVSLVAIVLFSLLAKM